MTHEKALKINEYEAQLKEEADQRARNLISHAIQRVAADQVTETTVSVVPLPNDEMKGRIIGREGRNIRAIETLTLSLIHIWLWSVCCRRSLCPPAHRC